MTNIETRVKINSSEPLVKTEALRKIYQLGAVAVTALNMEGRDLNVQRGEFLAVMGSSGSGKSTLLHILGGIERSDSGRLWIDGECLTDMDETRLTLFRRDKIGFVFQFFNLIPTLNVEENVALPLLITGRQAKRDDARIEELLAAVGLAERRRHKPSQLSGGEQQRTAIARAFAADPKIILMDEPTGNLDSKTGTRILELLAETHRKYQTTIVMVTHSPAAAAYAQRTVFLRDGAITAELERSTVARYDAEAIDRVLLQMS
jgi:putative ABC transport system ATP-binding protein